LLTDLTRHRCDVINHSSNRDGLRYVGGDHDRVTACFFIFAAMAVASAGQEMLSHQSSADVRPVMTVRV
jgi:hypothetical protein